MEYDPRLIPKNHYSYGVPVPEGHQNGHFYMAERLFVAREPERGRFALLCSECMKWTEGGNFKCDSPCSSAYGDMFTSDRHVCFYCEEKMRNPKPASSILSRKEKYRAYLLSPEWKEIRKRILTRDNYRCMLCPNTRYLDVHHRTYDNIFSENDEDLTTLCRSCHKKHHVEIA